MTDRNRQIDKFLVTHQKKLYGFIINRVRNKDEADDIFQATMEIVIYKYNTLSDPEKLNSWIISICKNEIYRYYKKQDKNISLENFEISDSETEYEYNNYTDLVKIALNFLTDNQRDVIQLRYFASMSYNDIALACNISIKKVKSRIFEAKIKLKGILPDLYEGILKPQTYFNSQKEKVIMEINNLRIGSYIFCRLSLVDQIKICEKVIGKEEFDSPLLENIGLIRQGKEFIKIFHSKLLLNELIGILNYSDRFTETRLIKELETVNRQIAETIKQNMFVFDDLVLLDADLIKELLSRVDRKDLIYSLCNASSQTKSNIFKCFTNSEKEQLVSEIGECDAVPETIMDSQQKIINILREMEKNDQIEIRRLDSQSEYHVGIYLKNKKKEQETNSIQN